MFKHKSLWNVDVNMGCCQIQHGRRLPTEGAFYPKLIFWFSFQNRIFSSIVLDAVINLEQNDVLYVYIDYFFLKLQPIYWGRVICPVTWQSAKHHLKRPKNTKVYYNIDCNSLFYQYEVFYCYSFEFIMV